MCREEQILEVGDLASSVRWGLVTWIEKKDELLTIVRRLVADESEENLQM